MRRIGHDRNSSYGRNYANKKKWVKKMSNKKIRHSENATDDTYSKLYDYFWELW